MKNHQTCQKFGKKMKKSPVQHVFKTDFSADFGYPNPSLILYNSLLMSLLLNLEAIPCLSAHRALKKGKIIVNMCSGGCMILIISQWLKSTFFEIFSSIFGPILKTFQKTILDFSLRDAVSRLKMGLL